ncbi:MAG: LysR family transcriptional regulator [Victivallales bacterium]|nr:LysR family transcriptional regulator [Victivallales bacterium]
MNTRQLKYVFTLAKDGSFSKAAETLGISQPSLSQYIKKIEEQIGLPLFDRTNGEVRLTDAGQVFIESGRKIIDLEHQMESQLADLSAHRTGSLVIGAAPYRTTCMLPIIAKRFQAIHPGMHLIVREGVTTELAEGMEHGDYDLCLTMLPIDDRIFAWRKIMEEELLLAVPAAHPPLRAKRLPGRKYQAIDVRYLDGKRLVKLTEAQYMQRLLDNLSADYGLSIGTAAVVKSLGAQVSMVRAGVGLALLPSGIERFCGKDEVAFYSFVQELPRREVVVMWRKECRLSTVAEELKSVICDISW